MITDERLQELIAVNELLVQMTLPLEDGDVELNQEYMDVLDALQELQTLRKQKAALIEDAERLATWIQGYDKQWAIQHGAPRILEQHESLMREVK